MPTVLPAFATVRPRVTRRGWSESRPADEVVAEIADELDGGLIEISGPSGSGKSMAVAHLAAALGANERLSFLDEPTAAELDVKQGLIVVADLPAGIERYGVELKLAPWGPDDLIESLLANWPEACAGVMSRLGDAARRRWSPRLAQIVLARFAANTAADNPIAELCGHIREQLPLWAQWHSACRYCLALHSLGLTSGQTVIASEQLEAVVCPNEVRKLLRHTVIHEQLAAEALVEGLDRKSIADLDRVLSAELTAIAGPRLRSHRRAMKTLTQALQPKTKPTIQAMAASLSYAAIPGRTWRPWARTDAWQLARGRFPAARWSGIVLENGDLSGADLGGANLIGACMRNAKLHQTNLSLADLSSANLIGIAANAARLAGAVLCGAKLSKASLPFCQLQEGDLSAADLTDVDLEGADLSGAHLGRADLTGARLKSAVLEGASFTGAMLRGAMLAGLDLRTVQFEGACLEEAILTEAQLEDVRWPAARLHGARMNRAHLTGSRMPCGDLRGVNLTSAGLAEIEWEGADLRGAILTDATFHMGSSRSGLVGSPIACEGSKTGFYTDDYEDKYFKRPEEIRKANLCGADLRGAKIDGLDFYLVDLRGAKLDSLQLEHVRRCGAILGKAVA